MTSVTSVRVSVEKASSWQTYHTYLVFQTPGVMAIVAEQPAAQGCMYTGRCNASARVYGGRTQGSPTLEQAAWGALQLMAAPVTSM